MEIPEGTRSHLLSGTQDDISSRNDVFLWQNVISQNQDRTRRDMTGKNDTITSPQVKLFEL